MVLLGLVLGVIVAVVFAANGCGSNRTRKHGGGHRGQVVALTEKFRAAPAQSTSFRRSVHAARRSDASGPFFGFRHAHMTRVDAPEQRAVALTFDDGPGPATGQIVGELRALHARATFFVVGTMAAIRPDMVRAERQAGMEVGNHTWTHPAMPTLTAAAQRLEIQRTNELLAHITGRRPRFFRPPNWRVGQRTAGIVARERMIGVLRTVDTRDWTLPGTGAIVRRALRVRPGGIVAMHDAGGYTRAQTVAAVPAIVRGLRRRHLRPVTVGQLYAGRR
jgi:peptidoglycan/xylan/chitin deacetylase (PgdA/CDA1 family)